MALPPKRNMEGDFITPSRRPVDSAIANGSDSTVQRSIEQELADLRRYLVRLNFSKARSEGYSSVRSNNDLVLDLTDENQDQQMIQETAYLSKQSPELEGAQGYGRSGGIFSGDQNTIPKEMDEALEAAKDLMIAAEGESLEVQRQMLSEIQDAHPQLFVTDKTNLVGNPLVKMAQRMSEEMNKSTLSGQRRAKRQNSVKRTQTFY